MENNKVYAVLYRNESELKSRAYDDADHGWYSSINVLGVYTNKEDAMKRIDIIEMNLLIILSVLVGASMAMILLLKMVTTMMNTSFMLIIMVMMTVTTMMVPIHFMNALRF